MISAWWLLLLVPVGLLGAIAGIGILLMALDAVGDWKRKDTHR